MATQINYAKAALSSASALLAAQWIMAIVSIPSASDYANKITDGVAAEDVVTLYDNLSLLITITLIWSWITTNRFLLPIYDQFAQANADSMRLKRGWVAWGWIAPIVNFWFPKRIVDDLLKAKLAKSDNSTQVVRATSTWWATWISFVLINDLGAFNALTGSADRIQPAYEIAAACMLTASYTVWIRIIKILGE